MNPDRVAPLQRLAAADRDLAARRLAEAARRLDEGRQRLAELLRYAQDYADHIEDDAPGVRLLANRREFLSKLLDAAARQEQEVTQLEAEYERARQSCVVAGQRVDMLGKLIEKGREQATREADRRSQREHDDLAASRHASSHQP